MTGYGKAQADGLRHCLVVEVRSVNSRHLDVSLRLPAGAWALEPAIRKRIQERFRRGRIELQVRWEPLDLQAEPAVDVQLGKARAFRRALENLREELSLPGAVDVALMASFRDLLGVREASLEEEGDALQAALEEALEALASMRGAEGRAMREDLTGRIRWLGTEVEEIQARVPRVVEAHIARWRERVSLLMGDQTLDPGRVEQEMGIWADRLDVTEELVRLNIHLERFMRMLEQEDGAGKKMEFLLQEMNREINTIGSKAMDAEVAHRVVEMKGQLERMREQIQNVE
jgi:uncharacterized protein (TIGR00255 family)